MGGYIVKRLLSVIPVFIVVAVVVFLILHLTPGDPALIILGPDATADQVEELRRQMGLNEPLFAQFVDWFVHLLQGDLGDSIYMRKPVLQVFMDHLGPTLSLTILAQLFAAIIAVPLGTVAAIKRNTAVDQSIMGFAMLGISVPNFLLGLFMILIFAVKLHWFPVAGYKGLDQGLSEYLRYIIMPSIALGIMSAAFLTRMTRASMLEVLHRDYIKTARAKGLNERVVLYKHALRNASIPILEVFGQQIGILIAGAAVIETVFNIPGIGQLIVTSVERRDYAVIQGTILIIACSYVILNIMIDLLYGVINPQVRLNQK